VNLDRAGKNHRQPERQAAPAKGKRGNPSNFMKGVGKRKKRGPYRIRRYKHRNSKKKKDEKQTKAKATVITRPGPKNTGKEGEKKTVQGGSGETGATWRGKSHDKKRGHQRECTLRKDN